MAVAVTSAGAVTPPATVPTLLVTSAPTTATADLIEFGPADQLIISVTPDTTMLDFTQVKLVKLELEYADPAHDIDVKHEFVLKEGANPPPWTFYARDPKLGERVGSIVADVD